MSGDDISKRWHEVSLAENRVKESDELTWSQLERLGRQVGNFEQWPNSEQQRFRRLLSWAEQKYPAIGIDGWPKK